MTAGIVAFMKPSLTGYKLRLSGTGVQSQQRGNLLRYQKLRGTAIG